MVLHSLLPCSRTSLPRRLGSIAQALGRRKMSTNMGTAAAGMNSSVAPAQQSSSRAAHADLTAHVERTTGRVHAQIINIHRLTPTVKRFRLHVAEGDCMAFRPGQWVDFYAPGLAVVGGYSITSPPSQLRSQRTFDLAVKLSSYAPAVWLHEQAAVGDRVQVQVGGSFCLTSQDMQRPLLFIAGGIGITPIAAMLAHLVGEGLPEQAGAREAPPPALLLYSAGTVEELVFRGKLLRLSQESKGTLEVQLHATKDQEQAMHGVRAGRLGQQELAAGLQRLSEGGPVVSVTAFICGPPRMVDDMAAMLHGLGLPQAAVKAEKWW